MQRDEEEAEAEERAVTAEVDQKRRDERRAVLLARASGETDKRSKVCPHSAVCAPSADPVRRLSSRGPR